MSVIKLDKKEHLDGIIDLYNKDGWTSYTEHRKSIKNMLSNSHNIGIIKDGNLIGFLRYLTDEEHVLFIQDLIVSKVCRRQGVASKLINWISSTYPHIRNINLITDESSVESNEFYKHSGFSKSSTLGLTSYFYTKNL